MPVFGASAAFFFGIFVEGATVSVEPSTLETNVPSFLPSGASSTGSHSANALSASADFAKTT